MEQLEINGRVLQAWLGGSPISDYFTGVILRLIMRRREELYNLAREFM